VDIRASDEDRERIVAALERHTGAGRLTLDEFAERVGVVSDARTLSELAAVVSDLPPDPAADTAARTQQDPDSKSHRDLLLVFAIAIATLILLGLYLAFRA
jgi:Domain of unknown function (DUF1707)